MADVFSGCANQRRVHVDSHNAARRELLPDAQGHVTNIAADVEHVQVVEPLFLEDLQTLVLLLSWIPKPIVTVVVSCKRR